ncbi:hypothetical protein HDR63_01775 [bacterium]|nr:hypothetical protein [bacterium]
MNKMKNNNLPKPALTIDAGQRFYLAALMRRDPQVARWYLYTLFLQRDAFGAYPMISHRETLTFDNATDADVYYKTMLDIIDAQKQTDFGASVHGFYEELIQEFYKMTR